MSKTAEPNRAPAERPSEFKAGVSPIAFGNQTIFRVSLEKQRPEHLGGRLTALRPSLTTGLPLSCAIVKLPKIVSGERR